MALIDRILALPPDKRRTTIALLDDEDRFLLDQVISVAIGLQKDDWYCDREECDGEPHDQWVHCTHVDPAEHRPACRHARSKQRPPPGDWFVWLIQTGRGWGKTLAASHWIRRQALNRPGTDWAIIAPTNRLLWRNCVDGPSGLLAVVKEGEIASVNRSSAVIHFTNGSRIYLESAEVPDRLRGTNLTGAWCDELGSWSRAEAWYEGLIPSVRIGEQARVCVTTTPRPSVLMRDLNKRDDGSVVVVKGTTYENASNLSRSALEEMRRRYEGTRVGRQEIHGELLEEIEGALWKRDWIDRNRMAPLASPQKLYELISPTRVVVAVDPAGTANPESDETGIVVMARGADGRAYVLEDLSGQHRVEYWPVVVIDAAKRWETDRVVAEVNFGADYIGNALKMAGYRGGYEAVRATHGKAVRAEPVAIAYQQDQVVHVGEFVELENQLVEWVPGNGDSPDRLDALVWAAHYLGFGTMNWASLYDASPKEEPADSVVPTRGGWSSVYTKREGQ